MRLIDEKGFAGAPVDAYVASASFVYYRPRVRLCGFALWGRPDGDELRRLERLLRLELAPDFPAHVSLVDARRLEGVDPGAFEALHGYVAKHRARLTEQVERLAIVRPVGLTGATVAGFFQVTEAPYPVETFASLVDALAWLGEDAAVAAEIEDAIGTATGAPPEVVALRRLLDARPGQVELEAAAKALGLSARSLQRLLQRAGLTYQGEVAASQVRIAQRLLRESSRPLSTIAFEVGCATPQHFSRLFRRLTGQSPSAWRAKESG